MTRPGQVDDDVTRNAPRRWRTEVISVLAATLMFGGVRLGFLMNTPLLQSPDELYHFDRIMASEHGHLAPDPGTMNTSQGSASVPAAYFPPPLPRLALSQLFAVTAAPARDSRASYQELGGDDRSSTANVPNYLTQHPPLYYAVMGGVAWLIPGSDTMPVDLLMWVLKLVNILLMLPLPYLMYRSARTLVGTSAIAQASAFLPLMVPGLAHSAASMNNDNLAIVIGAAVVALSLAVARGDQTARTAGWIAALCVAGSLTKSTVLFVLMIVPIAYLIAAIRVRRWPARHTMLILLAGAVATAAWWVRNVLVFGKFQPDGFGSNPIAIANPRPPGERGELAPFLRAVRDQVPSRFWAGLGLGGPPNLPKTMIWTLTILVIIAVIATIVTLTGRRIEFLTVFVVGVAAVAMLVWTSYRHWLHFVAASGLQGRYAYPGVFGILFPLTILGALLLRRLWRWTPVLIAAGGSLVSAWAIYTSADLFWLPPGQALRPGLFSSAVHRLLAWSAVPGAVGLGALVIAAAAWLGGGAWAIWAVVRNQDLRSLRAALADPDPHRGGEGRITEIASDAAGHRTTAGF